MPLQIRHEWPALEILFCPNCLHHFDQRSLEAGRAKEEGGEPQN